jgi:signal transduction histidine kinase
MHLRLKELSMGDEEIPWQFQAQFRAELLASNVRRIRLLLMLALPGLCVLAYMVHVRNVLDLSSAERSMILSGQVLLFGVLAVFAVMLFVHPNRSVQEHQLYFSRVVWLFCSSVMLVAQVFMYGLWATQGHPVFFYQVLITWAAALLMRPRTALVLGCTMFGMFALMTVVFSPSNQSWRLFVESLVSSAVITVIAVVSSMVLFRSAAREFARRVALEQERNTVALLNAELQSAYQETDAINKELKSRQDILENQAAEIEIINTQLQENNERLMTLNTEKNELMGIVSHDLKNPIALVTGYVALLERSDISQEEKALFIQRIQEASDRMLALVTNILDANRGDTTAITLNPVQVNIVGFVQAVVEQYTTLAVKKTIRITLIRTYEKGELNVNER